MLSVVEISNRIQNPNLVVPEDLSTLQELSVKYPYTQLFSILYLKALSKAGDPRFEEELNRHSYRISDRVQLYELIQDHDETESLQIPSETVEAPIETPIDIIPEPIEVIQEEETVEPPAEKAIEESTPIVNSDEEKITVEPESEPESESIVFEPLPKVEENEILEVAPTTIESTEEQIESVSEEPKTAEARIESKDNLEESILHHVYAANYRLEDLTEEEEKSIPSDKNPIATAPKEDGNNSDSEIEEETVKSQNETSSFTGWLHSNNNDAERDTSDKEAINAVVEDFSEFDPSSDLFGEVKKSKTEFFSPTKKAKKSLEESELPVSETLAKIYIMQGNYPQAISAYKQLSLAFPEKKIFFANLIEDLEKKLTNK